jgi:hypothetical protein
MTKRFTFQCWNCDKTYTLFREIGEDQKLIVACPYCDKEAVVDLTPFWKRKTTIRVVRGEGEGKSVVSSELELPEILPTQPADG